MLTAIKTRKITDEIVTQIREQIAKGGLAAGDKLPSEREMAQQLGVSRPTVREALQVLEHTGFVEIRHGSGTYVKEVSKDAIADPLELLVQGSERGFDEVYEFRTAMEVWAVGLAAQRAGAEELERLESIIRAMKSNHENGLPVNELDAQFHLSIARACSNGIYFHVASTVLHLYSQVAHISHRELFLSDEDQKELLADHEAIFRAIKARDADRARALMQHHLNRVTLRTTLAE